jgi:hypothetical protein
MGSNREKVAAKFAKLTKYDKASNRYNINVRIERKEINGTPQMTYTCEMYSNGPCCATVDSKEPEKQPLQKEFTDRSAFVEYVNKLIDEVDDQL